MADAAVRVDIVVGQNTVVPAVQETQRALQGAAGSAGTAMVGFESLNKRGLKAAEIGFRQLAFQAAGVPGPLGKIAEGALLLGGGGGLLLAVAAGAGSVALAWRALTGAGSDAAKAVDEMREALRKLSDEQARIGLGNEQANNLWSRSWWVRWASVVIPALQGVADQMARMAVEANTVTSAYSKMVEKTGVKDANKGLVSGQRAANKEAAAAAERARLRQAEIDNANAASLPAQWARNQDFTTVSQYLNLVAQAQAQWNEALAQTPALMDAVEVAIPGIEEGLQKANAGFLGMFDTIRMGVESVLPALAAGFEAIGASLVGVGSFGKALVNMFRQAFVDLARMHVAKELAEAAEAFASGTWPPNPLAIAAGLKHLKAAALWGIAGGVAAAAGGGVSASAATGGVSGGGYERDQRQIAAAGTVTVRMPRDGLIRASDPVFQEFLAQVIKEAKGRNVVFA